jgi:signal peptidase I
VSAAPADPDGAPASGPVVDPEPAPRPLVRQAKRLLRLADGLYKAHKKRLSTEGRERVEQARRGLAEALARKDGAVDLTAALRHLEQVVDDVLGFAKKSATRELVEALALAAVVALALRGLVLEPFKIPSPSMVPTLLVGDRLFVNKLSYGLRVPFTTRWVGHWSAPTRGEVIVFVYPRDPTKDYIKRVIALPGDRVRVEGRDVYVNGAPLVRGEPTVTTWDEDVEVGAEASIVGTRRVVSFPEHAADDGHTYTVYYGADPADRTPFPHGFPMPGVDCYPPVPTPRPDCVVLPGYVFVLGDNRDNSADSRAWGGVPLDYVRGRATLVWWSAAERAGSRWERVGLPIR